jgi:hypothetical protein
MAKPKCHKCNDTGWVAIRSRDASYAFPGPVPDDAKGYSDADCWYCDQGKPPVSPTISAERHAQFMGGIGDEVWD